LHLEEPPVEPLQPDLVEASSSPLLDPPPRRRSAAFVDGATAVVVEAAPSAQICKGEREE
jgi:3-oxoacyl-[acyl-carrier-protein] synthase III